MKEPGFLRQARDFLAHLLYSSLGGRFNSIVHLFLGLKSKYVKLWCVLAMPTARQECAGARNKFFKFGMHSSCLHGVKFFFFVFFDGNGFRSRISTSARRFSRAYTRKQM